MSNSVLTKEVKTVLNVQNLEEKINNYVALKKHLDEVTELLEQQKKEFKELMNTLNVDRLQSQENTIYLEKYTKNTFNTTSFKKEHLDLYQQYLKEINIEALKLG